MDDNLKKALTCIAIAAAILLGCSMFGSCCTDDIVHDYKYIYVDGRQYLTSNIVDIEYIPLRYGNDAVIFKFEDGTVVRTSNNNYTLGN